MGSTPHPSIDNDIFHTCKFMNCDVGYTYSLDRLFKSASRDYIHVHVYERREDRQRERWKG